MFVFKNYGNDTQIHPSRLKRYRIKEHETILFGILLKCTLHANRFSHPNQDPLFVWHAQCSPIASCENSKFMQFLFWGKPCRKQFSTRFTTKSFTFGVYMLLCSFDAKFRFLLFLSIWYVLLSYLYDDYALSSCWEPSERYNKSSFCGLIFTRFTVANEGA